MTRITFSKGCRLAVIVATAFAASHSHGKNEKTHEKHQKQQSSVKHFDDKHRNVAHAYYSEQFKRGKCPPGLAKKQNGCLPPGQARNWTVGQPLQRDVVFHRLPAALSTQIGEPPAGQRYVRVGNDVLLVSNRSGIVLDAMRELGLK